MKIAKLKISNFRGIKEGDIFFPSHGVLVGDNNTGKSTILEAIDLVLGPERMRSRPVIDEHDFYAGDYLDAEKKSIEINVEVIIIGLSSEQEVHFKDNIEWWKASTNKLLTEPPLEATDAIEIQSALRVCFVGNYDPEEDDFVGDTFFMSPVKDNGEKIQFRTKDKRQCGFLFLRTLRTGSRALSLERGSLLDIILNLSDVKLKMWEETLDQLRVIAVAEKPEIGVTNILSGLQSALRSFVPSEWGTYPQMKISDLTRENLRKNLNVFIATGAKRINGDSHSAPFKKQGTGTINTLVLSMLSMIADLKQNVIFAMEEPEIAIPPHTQKRIISSIRTKSSQALFTSHSPYVIEEFDPSEVIVLQNSDGKVSSSTASFPPAIKRKNYKEQFRKKYCEALLSKRVLITEGRTEYDSIPVAARRLHAIDSQKYSSLEALGVAVIDAETDSQIIAIASHLKSMGKIVYAVYDKQEAEQSAKIEKAVDHSFESSETSFEKLILNKIPAARLKTFAISIVTNEDWPDHLHSQTPNENASEEDIKEALSKYFNWSKGAGSAANLIESCEFDEIPEFISTMLESIKSTVVTKPEPDVSSQVNTIAAQEVNDDDSTL